MKQLLFIFSFLCITHTHFAVSTIVYRELPEEQKTLQQLHSKKQKKGKKISWWSKLFKKSKSKKLKDEKPLPRMSRWAIFTLLFFPTSFILPYLFFPLFILYGIFSIKGFLQAKANSEQYDMKVVKALFISFFIYTALILGLYILVAIALSGL